jgi:sulfur carrier protein
MHILLNGENHELEDSLSISALLEQTGLSGKRIAVEVNESIVPRSLHGDTFVNEGDKIEIIHAIGGG